MFDVKWLVDFYRTKLLSDSMFKDFSENILNVSIHYGSIGEYVVDNNKWEELLSYIEIY